MDLKNLVFDVLNTFLKKDAKRMRKIHNKIIREAALSFSKDLFNLAILSYVLSKLLSKPRFSSKAYLPFREEIIKDLSNFNNDFNKTYVSIMTVIDRLDESDRRFVISLTKKGRLKVAATLYAQGISLGTVAKISGIEKHEILSYAGKTMMFDRIKEQLPVEKRMKIARRLLYE